MTVNDVKYRKNRETIMRYAMTRPNLRKTAKEFTNLSDKLIYDEDEAGFKDVFRFVRTALKLSAIVCWDARSIWPLRGVVRGVIRGLKKI